MHILFYWLVSINLYGIIITYWDKQCAKRHSRRIREKHLFLISILGGCPGVYLTMRYIHHKTLHKRFMLGIPMIFVFQLALCGLIWHYILR